MEVCLAEARVRLLPEAWAGRVSNFIRSGGTAEEAESEGRPETVLSRVYLPAQMGYYSDFNVRSRHFRCLETFFVAVGPDDEIHAVVSVDGLRSTRVVTAVNLIVAQRSRGDRAGDLAALLDGVLREAQRYSATERLRISYLYDTSFEAPVGVRIATVLSDPPDALPLREEARFPNETGRNREAVMLAFDGLDSGARAAAEALPR